MIVEWIVERSWLVGVVTFFLMWSDWLLTILQERERQLHYFEHYESYPINTIEGHPLFQKAVTKKRIFEPRHIIPALILSIVVAFSLIWIPLIFRPILVGYVWGLFLIVDTTHLSNLIGYRAGRKGLHGKLYMHIRTGYIVQMGRYIAMAVFLISLAILSANLFISGVAIAGISSAIRQLVWLRRFPKIEGADLPPAEK